MVKAGFEDMELATKQGGSLRMATSAPPASELVPRPSSGPPLWPPL